MSASPSLERIQTLDAIEKEIVTCLHSAGNHEYHKNIIKLLFLQHFHRTSLCGIKQGEIQHETS